MRLSASLLLPFALGCGSGAPGRGSSSLGAAASSTASTTAHAIGGSASTSSASSSGGGAGSTSTASMSSSTTGRGASSSGASSSEAASASSSSSGASITLGSSSAAGSTSSSSTSATTAGSSGSSLSSSSGGSSGVDAGAPDAGAPDAGSADAGPPARLAGDEADSDLAVENLLLRFWSQTESSLDADYPQSGTATGYWTLAQGYDAVLDGIQRTEGERFAGFMQTLYAAQSARGWSRPYYDDENWMALALLSAYDLSGDTDTASLDEAESLLGDIMSHAWDATCCGEHPGGDWWDTAHTQKATASNAGPVITAVRLYERTGQASYLAFATQVFAYWWANMVDPTTHAVIDHIETDGGLVRYRFTYNEGLMIGAAVELHRATGVASYLADAQAIAGYALSAETVSTSYGAVLNDGTNTGCTGDCQQFKGIGHRYLGELAAIAPTASIASLLTADADAIWNLARDPGSTTFATDWAGPSLSATTVDADSSATMALNLFTESEGPPPSPTANADTYEAEDGVLHGLGYEASHAGFSGWGYVAGWDADGEWVDFHPVVPAAGSYQLSFRYAAGAGNASRYVYVNGASAVANLALASTGSWTSYATVTTSVTLTAGQNTVSLIYNSSEGSTGYVNLDALTVEPAPTCSSGALAAPAPTSPPANAAGCAPPTLCWSAVAGATSYRVILDGQVACTTSSSTCCAPSAWSAGSHRWYAEATDGCRWQAGPPEHLTGGSTLGALANPSPADGAAVSSTPVLTWSSVGGAASYDVALDGALLCAGLELASCRPSAVASGAHTWTVTASGVCGTTSASWSFTR